MYECATCDRKFRYREDLELHNTTCTLTRTRPRKFVFGKSKGGGGDGSRAGDGRIQTTIVDTQPNTDNMMAMIMSLTAEMSAMRAEMTVLTTEVARQKRNDAARGKRTIVADMRARQPAEMSFHDWILNTVATEAHLQKIIDFELVDGLEAMSYNAVGIPSAPIVVVPGTKPVIYAYMHSPVTEWRKLDDADYEYIRTEFTRKILGLFDKWQKTNAKRIESSETENQRNIACMSKIYGSRGPALTHRAADFRKRVLRIALELRPVPTD